ncbi:ankyrin repeat-containing domain protein [Colletotrichum lupini]|nr:ankyrin repeat-containing domain protein [Colletotrichum lupini]
MQPEVLDALLSAGGNANIRVEKNDKEPWEPETRRWDLSKLPDAEWYPLHRVAAKSGNTTYDQKERTKLHSSALSLTEVLLSHGDDPLSNFSRCSGKDCYHQKIYSRLQAKGLYMFDEAPDSYDAVGDPEYSFEPHLHEDCVVLHQLLADGHIVHPFLKLPAIDANHRDGSGRTLLHAACSSKRGPDVPLDLLPGDPWNPQTSKEVSVFDHLVSLGADVEARDTYRQNVLHHMLSPPSKHIYETPIIEKSLTYTIEKHPSIIDQRDNEGKTPLYLAIHRALYEKRTTAADALLRAGADPLIPDNEGNTVLHVLSRMLWVSSMRPLFNALVERGCDVNARNLKGETPLFWYYAGFDKELHEVYTFNRDPQLYDEEGGIGAFEAACADFGAVDDDGRSLLHVAAEGHVLRFKTLTARGLDPLLEDKSRKTAVDVAAACGNKGVLKLFRRVDAVDDPEEDDDDESLNVNDVFWPR